MSQPKVRGASGPPSRRGDGPPPPRPCPAFGYLRLVWYKTSSFGGRERTRGLSARYTRQTSIVEGSWGLFVWLNLNVAPRTCTSRNRLSTAPGSSRDQKTSWCCWAVCYESLNWRETQWKTQSLKLTCECIRARLNTFLFVCCASLFWAAMHLTRDCIGAAPRRGVMYVCSTRQLPLPDVSSPASNNLSIINPTQPILFRTTNTATLKL